MTKPLKFVNAIILFISLFLLSKKTCEAVVRCEKDEDCPISGFEPLIFKCINNLCEAVKKDPKAPIVFT
ncbi:unnamed protein product [Lathyrus oleraceus]